MNHSDKSSAFRSLHQPGSFLILPNAWDASSARVIETSGAPAIATSSAAMSWAHGVPDGEHLHPSQVIDAAKDIIQVVNVPVSVDVEMGYHAEPERIATTLVALFEIGVVGLNIEDGTAPPEVLAKKIEVAKRAAAHAGVDAFVNARTDVYLKGLVPPERRLEEVLARARRYRDAGCDGLFVPRLVMQAEIETIVSAFDLPLNVLAVPGIAPAAELRRWGVRRLSVGQAVAQVALAAVRRASRELVESGTYGALFAEVVPFAEMEQLFRRSQI